MPLLGPHSEVELAAVADGDQQELYLETQHVAAEKGNDKKAHLVLDRRNPHREEEVYILEPS